MLKHCKELIAVSLAARFSQQQVFFCLFRGVLCAHTWSLQEAQNALIQDDSS